MQIKGVEVAFNKGDNIKLERLVRLFGSKIGTIVASLDKDISKVIPDILNDDDFEKVATILLENTTVFGIGDMKDPAKVRDLMDVHGFPFYYTLIFEAGRYYLGKHLSIALEKGYIPQVLKTELEKYTAVLKGQLSGMLLKADTVTTDPQ